MANKGLTKKRIGGRAMAIVLGRTLQQEHPEIAKLYIKNPIRIIAIDLGIEVIYGVTPSVARKSVQCAIAGHDGSLEIPPYAGLVGKRERKIICRAHHRENNRQLYQARRGIHGRTLEEMQKHGREIIRRLTPQKRREYSALGVISRGQTPITEDEKQAVYEFAQKGHSRLEIAQWVNGYYHRGLEVRSVGAVGIMRHRYQESLKAKAQSD